MIAMPPTAGQRAGLKLRPELMVAAPAGGLQTGSVPGGADGAREEEC
jgi:hypothetical protein